MSAAQEAVSLKQQGNELFKAGEFKQACTSYEKAEQCDPKNYVYPSNLSAALYELGDYTGSIDAVVRSWRLLRDRSDAKVELITRLSTRLAKSLCHGARAGTVTNKLLRRVASDVRQLREASMNGAPDEELKRVWDEWTTVYHELVPCAEKAHASLTGLSRLPLFFKPLDPTKEFFSIGTDDIIDLTQGWGPHDPHPLDLDKLPPEMLSELSFLFGGVGDGRHVLGTLSGLHLAYKKLTKKKQKRFHAHLTLLDIHDATIARDLCLLMLLHDLNRTKDPMSRVEINATLMYMYTGMAMPSYCHERLEGVIRDLRGRLSAAPPDLPPWLHVVSDSIPEVLQTLDFWIQTTKSTKRMLAHHETASEMDSPESAAMSRLPGTNPEFRKKVESNIASDREALRQQLLNATDEELGKGGFLNEGQDPQYVREYIRDHIDEFVDTIYKSYRGGKVPLFEENWYRLFKVFLPPAELRKRHFGFDAAWKEILDGREVNPGLQQKAMAHIESKWKPNITLFDLKCADPMVYADADGYPDFKMDMFTTIASLDQFNRRNGPDAQQRIRSNPNMLAWNTCNTFFEEAAIALEALGSCLMIELICGGLSEELAKMRYKGDLTRPEEFPRKYTRMWLSNVPDYTHGPMNMIFFVLPNLQEDSQAAMACNSMYNIGAWANDEEFIHTYTLLLPEEIPRYLACNVIDCRPVFDVLVLGAKPLPRPLSELATREELLTWLTRVLFNTFIPGHSKFRPSHVRLPHNLVAFFGIVMYLHRIGYPGHWLSEFLAKVLSGSMVSDVRPYDDFYPIPVSERTRRMHMRKVRTDPWLIEFETIIATAYYAIPFPISGALPADFTRDAGDIAVWEAQVRPAQYFSQRAFMNFSHPRDPRTQLLFFRGDVTNQTVLIDEIQKIFEGKASPPPGTFFVMTAQEYVQYETRVRFRLSRRRVERMRKESSKWSMMAYRNDTGQQATLPVPIDRWVLYDKDTA
ncbi:hypothetical protein K466DRAFT_527474 [Polyporus arcularius HHB13444]|uniref:DUF4470 domain-containing protein n=1 Tax=Polyporus arcularius HHB13444 TaxID=1314778 RepID=A0A5C3P5T9_9APHY|nr:hypothetical protein K466DRAFT_527474 [Polyporus arcularius HHB13444]